MVWASPDSGYAVLRVRTEEGLVTAVGPLAGVGEVGEEAGFIALEGRWEQHSVHGRQFRASGYLPSTPRTAAGLEAYLRHASIHGVGASIARRIVDHFGVDTMRILEQEPGRLQEVDGVGPQRAEAIAARWRGDSAERTLTVTLRGLGLGSALIDRIRARYGERAQEIVAGQPYRLVEEIRGVGFRTADALARELGLDAEDPARARAAVQHVVRQAEQDGHCYLPRAEVNTRVRKLGVPDLHVDPAIDEAVLAGRLVAEPADDAVLGDMGGWTAHPEDRIWWAPRYRDEARVAEFLAEQVRGRQQAPADEVAHAARLCEVQLDGIQQEAVATALGGGVVVVTGGPGTGKTTLVRVLLRAARERGEQWELASPTGRAAKRLSEATLAEARTLHRLLEYSPAEGGFQRGFDKPLEGHGLVVDEVSMVDIQLLRALVDAIPGPDYTLVLVGDADQLPSVGAGQVLRDIICSQTLPVVRLERVYRQAGDSGIIAAARAVHGGRVPTSGTRAEDDVFLLARHDAHQAARTLAHVVVDRLPSLGYDPLDDVQVIAPTRRGPLGTRALNEALQQRLNPDGAPLRRGDTEIRAGDKILCTRNSYDLDVFNGDVGRVLEVRAGSLLASFDGRRVEWPREQLSNLELGYAITVHKAQGSEYPAVVLALDRSHGLMLRRNLFYTAITRARRFVCVVGDPRAWQRAAGRAGSDERYTWLARRLAANAAAPGGAG